MREKNQKLKNLGENHPGKHSHSRAEKNEQKQSRTNLHFGAHCISKKWVTFRNYYCTLTSSLSSPHLTPPIHFGAHKLRNLKLSKIKNPKKFQISVSNFLVEQDIGLRVENLL